MLEYVNFPDPQLYIIGFSIAKRDDFKDPSLGAQDQREGVVEREAEFMYD